MDRQKEDKPEKNRGFKRTRYPGVNLDAEPCPEKGVMHTELPCDIYLFQAVCADERMEAVIRCAVDLGVYEIIPVEMKNCTADTEVRKVERKRTRWQSISDVAADGSKRSFAPHIHRLMSFPEALVYAKSFCDVRLVPYEKETDGLSMERALKKIKPGQGICVFIGPEEGFAEEEVGSMERDMDFISLGNRILRNDTAAVCTLYAVTRRLEKQKS